MRLKRYMDQPSCLHLVESLGSGRQLEADEQIICDRMQVFTKDTVKTQCVIYYPEISRFTNES
jgi:hypothetical protein